MKGRKPFRVVVAEPFDDESLRILTQIAELHRLDDSSPQSILAAIPGADAILVRSKAHITARVLEAGTNLKVIGRASPNVDHIDLRAASRRNVQVVYSPHVAVRSTAELALAMILSLNRRLKVYDTQIREGKFEALRAPTGRELGRLTLGLLGADMVAKTLADYCSRAFEMKIRCHDLIGEAETGMIGEKLDLAKLLTESDVISVHLPLTPQTRGLLNADRLAMMKPTAILVNTSRGAVVDTIALARALQESRLGAAGLDVFEVEPLPLDHPIRSAPRCVLTPHIGGATLDAQAERNQVVKDVARVLTGETPRFAHDLRGLRA